MRTVKITDNEILATLSAQDQRDRKTFFKNPDGVTANDKKRREKVDLLLQRRKVQTARDYFNAALIYQHGLEVKDYEKACKLAQKSIELGGGASAKWLYAVAIDRRLTAQGKKQKFGMQFNIVLERNPKTGRVRKVMRIRPYDRRTSDKTRAKYGLSPLRDILAANEGKPAPKRQKKVIFTLE